MKITLLSIFIFCLSFIYAQQAYYNNVDLTLSGIPLKNELANKISVTHTNNLSYTEVWGALQIIDLVPSNASNVFLVYGYDDNDGDITTDLTRNKNNNGGNVGDWNREHVYPKSLGTPDLGTSGPGADAHLIRACDVQRNSIRNNRKFADGSGDSQLVNLIDWYPGDEWKGDMARIIMYTYLRYGSRCLPINVGIGTSITIDPDMIDLFLQWNAEDSVSQYEMNRNNYLESISNTYGQGNRNPFIDNPFLATRIWGGPIAEDTWQIYLSVNENDKELITIYPNPAKDFVSISVDKSITIQEISLYTSIGQLVHSESIPISHEFQFHDLNIGVYFIQIYSSKGILTKKIVIE